jgi:hypothetical protein
MVHVSSTAEEREAFIESSPKMGGEHAMQPPLGDRIIQDKLAHLSDALFAAVELFNSSRLVGFRKGCPRANPPLSSPTVTPSLFLVGAHT